MTQTLRSIIDKQSNDYSSLVKGTKFDSLSPLISISVIIPAFNAEKTILLTLHSLNNQRLSKKDKKHVEVIIVNNGSADQTATLVKQCILDYDLTLVHTNQNYCRAVARNIGISLARNDVLVFLDADVIVDCNYIRHTMDFHSSFMDKAILVGLRENVTLANFDDALINTPDYRADFRFYAQVVPGMVDVDGLVAQEYQQVFLLLETAFFKSFGFGRKVRLWKLPSMVLTSNMSVSKKICQLVGGFNHSFQKWGMEDCFFGACLIAQGLFVIPSIINTVYHLETTPSNTLNDMKYKELYENTIIYNELLSKNIGSIQNDLRLIYENWNKYVQSFEMVAKTFTD